MNRYESLFGESFVLVIVVFGILTMIAGPRYASRLVGTIVQFFVRLAFDLVTAVLSLGFDIIGQTLRYVGRQIDARIRRATRLPPPAPPVPPSHGRCHQPGCADPYFHHGPHHH